MNTLQTITDLCAIIHQQNEIIEAQASELEQFGAVARAEEIAALRQKYAKTMGEEVTTA